MSGPVGEADYLNPRTAGGLRSGSFMLLCSDCFNSEDLKRQIVAIRARYQLGKCDFHPRKKGIPAEAVASLVDQTFRDNYIVEEEEPFYPIYTPEISDDWTDFYGGGPADPPTFLEVLETLTRAIHEPIITVLADQLILNDIRLATAEGERFYDHYNHYGSALRPTDDGSSVLWQRFCNSVIHERRYFNRDAKEVLSKIFHNIHLQQDVFHERPIYILDPGRQKTRIYRARIVDPQELRSIYQNPVGGMGAAPPRSGRANRMNPSGIQAFYGSFEYRTCLSELRPLVGDTVAIACFELSRPICVLDMTRFEASPKDPGLARGRSRRLAQWRFMRRFMDEIARPISPSDERLGYLPTQVVAEYLNCEHSVRLDGSERHIDAVVYNSAQRRAGRNIALLGDAALAETKAVATLKADADVSTFEGFQLWRPQRVNPALRLIEKSLRAVKVIGADFNHRPLDSPSSTASSS